MSYISYSLSIHNMKHVLSISIIVHGAFHLCILACDTLGHLLNGEGMAETHENGRRIIFHIGNTAI